LRQLVRGALAEMRTLLFELRPDSLAVADLETLFHQLSDALTGRTRTPVEVQIDGTIELPAEVKITLYRIVQEAFNNIIKHAMSQEVTVSLQQNPEEVILTVEDDGYGFDPDKIAGEKMGLRFMRERAENIQAQLDVIASPGQGTLISVIWPKQVEGE
jgi:signal transduction histidine kinase